MYLIPKIIVVWAGFFLNLKFCAVYCSKNSAQKLEEIPRYAV
jgi:hypothetical protein